MTDSFDHPLYSGLQALAASAFPKRCRNCGRIYHDIDAYIAETRFLNKENSGLKEANADDGTITLELFRACPCGSTLMEVFNNRRDVSENGIKRRNNFDQLMQKVQHEYNVDDKTAREEILKIMRGEQSQIIKNIIPSEN